jgi:plasmid stabilization system protein ParE
MGSNKYKVIWSKAAFEDYEQILDYLIRFWNKEVALSFISKIEHKQKQIASQPETGRVSPKDNSIRSVLVTIHNRLYYSIEQNSIHILRIYDTRQNPIKNPFE